jgi:hypothetical protein
VGLIQQLDEDDKQTIFKLIDKSSPIKNSRTSSKKTWQLYKIKKAQPFLPIGLLCHSLHVAGQATRNN